MRLLTLNRTLVAGAIALLAGFAATAAGAAQNSPKDIVTGFYRMVFEDHRVKEGFDQYVGPTYTQHNPNVPDGPEATIRFLSGRFEKNPQATNKIIRVIADGDLVAVHVHSTLNPQDRGNAIVDIFRVTNGRIVEHWDVIQPVPETAANPNTMF